MSVVRSALALGMVAAALAGPATAPPASAQDEIVAQGNQAYQDGDWASAIAAYESVLEAGWASAGLEYNLGNAYFKAGRLGPAILHWERARRLAPSDPDIRANLELARSLTPDAIEPLPRFWLFALADRWIDLLPRGILLAVVASAWLAVTGGAAARIVWRDGGGAGVSRSAIVVGIALLVLFLPSFAVRELGLGRAERAVVLAESVPVRSAPSDDDDLTLFEIHEGTRVRIDQRTGAWAEIVLDDGKVGWAPLETMGVI